MTENEQRLQKTIDALTQVNNVLMRQLEELNIQIKHLNAQLAWYHRRMFGRSSEKRLQLDEGPTLFDGMEGFEPPVQEGNGAEKEADKQSAQESDNGPEGQPVSDAASKSVPRKSASKRGFDWEKLPVLKTISYEPEDVDRDRYRKIGEEVTYTAEYEPGKAYRVAHIRPKYGLIDSTEVVERGQGVLIAPMPLLPIPKGIAGASLLAEILLQKNEYHAPFYREIKQLAHLGMTGIKETTLVGWFKRTVELLRPLYNRLVEEILKSDYCQADETTVGVINSQKHKTDKEYLWMVRAVMERLAAFFYDEGSRSGTVIKDLTDKYGFKGYLQCDGFSGYTAAYKPGSGVTLVNCLVHIRRHFERALEENRKEASWFLRKIQELYRIEHECDQAGMSVDQRRAMRLTRSKPIMDEMRIWMETEGIHFSQRTLIGQAVSYAYTRWTNMEHVLEDGRLLLDNNLAENEIRPITLGRKNYLFCGNHEAAGNMCVIASLLATCRNHEVNPRLYLNDIIAKMPYMEKASGEELAELLPHRWKLTHTEAIIQNLREKIK